MATIQFPFGEVEITVTGTTANVSDVATLGSSTTDVPSQRAVKVYVDNGLSTKQNLIDSSAVLAAAIGDETGSGVAVFATSPTLVTPTIGVATATTINKVTITAPTTSATLTLVTGSSLITAGAYAITLTASNTTGITLPTTGTLATLTGAETLTNKTLTTPVLGSATATKITFAGGAGGVPIIIGVKSNTADAGRILVGTYDPDSTGGVMIFCDDGGDAPTQITSPIWTRYLLTVGQTTEGATETGAYLQLKTYGTLTFATGSITAAKIYNQAGTITLTGAEYGIINAGMSLEGNFVNTSGMLAGIDVNINGAFSITDTATNSAAIIIRKVSGSTAVWPVGLKINTGGAKKGVDIGVTLTGTANLDANTITITDNSTAGAYCRGLAISATAAGTKTGSGELDGIGIDMTYSGNTMNGYNISLYGAASGNPTLGFVSNVSIYEDDLGTALGAYVAIDVGIALSHAPAGRYTYMRFRDHSSAIPTSVFRFEGAHCATYLFEYMETGTPDFIIGAAVSSTQDKKVKVNINGTPYYIPLYIA